MQLPPAAAAIISEPSNGGDCWRQMGEAAARPTTWHLEKQLNHFCRIALLHLHCIMRISECLQAQLFLRTLYIHSSDPPTTNPIAIRHPPIQRGGEGLNTLLGTTTIFH